MDLLECIWLLLKSINIHDFSVDQVYVLVDAFQFSFPFSLEVYIWLVCNAVGILFSKGALL